MGVGVGVGVGWGGGAYVGPRVARFMFAIHAARRGAARREGRRRSNVCVCVRAAPRPQRWGAELYELRQDLEDVGVELLQRDREGPT